MCRQYQWKLLREGCGEKYNHNLASFSKTLKELNIYTLQFNLNVSLSERFIRAHVEEQVAIGFGEQTTSTRPFECYRTRPAPHADSLPLGYL